MQRLKLSEADISGTSKRLTLISKADQMIRVFGTPEQTVAWEKVNYMWVFRVGEDMLLSIYDYKDSRDFDKIDEWSVGGKNLTVADAMMLINAAFHDAGEEYKELA